MESFPDEGILQKICRFGLGISILIFHDLDERGLAFHISVDTFDDSKRYLSDILEYT